MTRGQDKVFLKLIPHAKEKARLDSVGKERKLEFNSYYRKVVEEAGHFLQESHGEELAKNILDFLKSQK